MLHAKTFLFFTFYLWQTTQQKPSKKNIYLGKKKTQTEIIMNVNKLSSKRKERKGKMDSEREEKDR